MSLFNPIVVAAILVSLGISVFISIRRRKRDVGKYIEPVLKQWGVELISSDDPGMFKVGPFPKIEVEIGMKQSEVLGIRGEYSVYRIVRFRDKQGRDLEIWALVEFQMFRFWRIRWRAENKEGLPASVLAILEN